MKTALPEIISTEEFADLLGVTPRQVRNIVSDGICISAGRGKIALKSSIRGLIDHARRSADRDAEAVSRAALNEIRRRREEARLAIMSGDFMPREEAEAILDEMMAVIRFALGTMPSRIAGNDWNLRRKIEAARDEALGAASEKLEKMSQERKST
jgi:phage terminase Nu1 subunit (DNA packaging protein)